MRVGTSNPIIAKPTRLHGIALSIAAAIFFEKIFSSASSSLLKSKYLSTSRLGITSVCPFAKGKISRNAKQCSFSAILWQGISPAIILENILGTYRVISKISKGITPAGTSTSAISPTLFPTRPLPIGESIEIFFSARLASFSATNVYVTSAPFF